MRVRVTRTLTRADDKNLSRREKYMDSAGVRNFRGLINSSRVRDSVSRDAASCGNSHGPAGL